MLYNGKVGVQDRHFPAFILDNPIRRLFHPPQKKLRKYISEGDQVADLGCGPGYYTIAMAKMVGKDGKVYAIDSDMRAIAKLRKKAARLGLEKVIIADGSSAADLHIIGDNSLDFILSNGVICCMVDHEGAVREMVRILKPGGTAYIEVSRQLPSKDPRSVSKNEWKGLFSGFQLLEEGERISSRWAIVKK